MKIVRTTPPSCGPDLLCFRELYCFEYRGSNYMSNLSPFSAVWYFKHLETILETMILWFSWGTARSGPSSRQPMVVCLWHGGMACRFSTLEAQSMHKLFDLLEDIWSVNPSVSLGHCVLHVNTCRVRCGWCGNARFVATSDADGMMLRHSGLCACLSWNCG